MALRCTLRLEATWGILATPIGRAGHICSANDEILLIFLFVARRLLAEYVQIAGPLVLAQHKGNERKGKVDTYLLCLACCNRNCQLISLC
jgi:hypothetical protein